MKKRKIAIAAVAAVAAVTLIVAGGYTMYSNKDNIDFGEKYRNVRRSLSRETIDRGVNNAY